MLRTSPLGYLLDPGGLDVAGFHLHAVSNNLDAAAHAAFIDERAIGLDELRTAFTGTMRKLFGGPAELGAAAATVASSSGAVAGSATAS